MEHMREREEGKGRQREGEALAYFDDKFTTRPEIPAFRQFHQLELQITQGAPSGKKMVAR